MTTAITDATAWDTASLVSSARVLCSGGGTSLVNVLAKRRPRALVISAVRPVTNIFWVLYFTLLPSIGVLYAAFIPKAGRGKLAHSLYISENLFPAEKGRSIVFLKGMPCSTIMSIPRSLVFVAGAFTRSPDGHARSAGRNCRRRTTDHSYQDASGYISGPPPQT